MTPHKPTQAGRAIQRSKADHQSAALNNLTAISHRDDVRDRLRADIQAGAVRVRPWPGDPDRVEVVLIRDEESQR